MYAYGHVPKKVAVHDITKIEKPKHFNKVPCEEFLLHKGYKSCYGYYEFLFQSNSDTKDWKNTNINFVITVSIFLYRQILKEKCN